LFDVAQDLVITEVACGSTTGIYCERLLMKVGDVYVPWASSCIGSCHCPDVIDAKGNENPFPAGRFDL